MVKKFGKVLIIVLLLSYTIVYATDPDLSAMQVQTEASGTVSNVEEKNSQNQDTTKKIKTTQQKQTTKEQAKTSNDATLKGIKIDQEITPKFSPDVTEYYATVDLTVNQISITAEKMNSKAKYYVTGNKNIVEGENIIKIIVTAEDKITTKTYNIHVTKVDDTNKTNAMLKKLEIEGYKISPNFRNDIFSYNISSENEIEFLNITAETEVEGATISIEGNEKLEKGDNTVKVVITAEDGKTSQTYRIYVHISKSGIKIKEEDKNPAYISLGVIILTVFILAIKIIIKNNKK